MKILIAEDDYASRLSLQQILEGKGECEIATDGNEALKKLLGALPDDPYDLVLLDLGLPLMEGKEVLRKYREGEASHRIPQSKQARVLVITVNDEPASIKAAFNLGCEAYLVKPIVAKDVLSRVERLTEMISRSD